MVFFWDGKLGNGLGLERKLRFIAYGLVILTLLVHTNITNFFKEHSQIKTIKVNKDSKLEFTWAFLCFQLFLAQTLAYMLVKLTLHCIVIKYPNMEWVNTLDVYVSLM